MPVPRAPAIERNMNLTWDIPQMVDYVRFVSEMEVNDSLSDGVMGNMGICRCDRWIEVFKYASKPTVLGLAKGDVGIDYPLEKQSLKMIPIEAMNESVRDGLFFRVGSVEIQHLDNIS
ncbi:hypothetical protein RJ55_01260 [Drechmeria coniospora]|nr:hypothetical protein RJ55_01260 [Drechmeria coniospora]